MKNLNRYRYTISLRIRHPILTAVEICSAVPLAPKRAWSVGEPRTIPKGVPLQDRYEESYCTFPVGEGLDELAAALEASADRLTPLRGFFRETWAAGGTAELFVGWFIAGGNAGDAFDPSLLARLGDLALRLSLDVYPEGG